MEITNYCLSCICKAVTGCIRSERTKCYNDDAFCGSFKFGKGFWIEAGKCTKSPDDDPNDPDGAYIFLKKLFDFILMKMFLAKYFSLEKLCSRFCLCN